MKKINRLVFLLTFLGLLGFSWPFFSTPTYKEPEGTHAWVQRQVQVLKSQASNIDTNVLRLSLIAYLNARKKGFHHRPLLTVIDYSKPSNEKRLWVFNLKNGKALFNTWVAHGKNSGGILPTSFSNQNGSLKSSIGVFMTTQPYMGGNGYSLRLRGLEQRINDNSLRRNIVIHGAWYVNPDSIKRRGQAGRSWGCPAVGTALVKPLIDTIKENTLVVAYYPDRNWLSRSSFLTG